MLLSCCRGAQKTCETRRTGARASHKPPTQTKAAQAETQSRKHRSRETPKRKRHKPRKADTTENTEPRNTENKERHNTQKAETETEKPPIIESAWSHWNLPNLAEAISRTEDNWSSRPNAPLSRGRRNSRYALRCISRIFWQLRQPSWQPLLESYVV